MELVAPTVAVGAQDPEGVVLDGGVAVGGVEETGPAVRHRSAVVDRNGLVAAS